MTQYFRLDEEFARELDSRDELATYRERFYIPDSTIYMDGNSLGLLSKDAEQSILRVLNEWKRLGINGWLKGEVPWFYYAEELGRMEEPLVGAETGEVIVTNSTTVNLHQLVSTFYNPQGRRTKILADELNFPSDLYALRSQIELKGLKSNEHLKLVKSNDGKTLSENKIIEAMDEEVAIVLLPSVLYRSGQLLDMEAITKAAHDKGILIGFDLSHSIGAIPHELSRWSVDFAFWCNYKYMNNGPGGTGGLYLNKKHFHRTPGLAGWFGYSKSKQFDMSIHYENEPNAGGWQIGTTNLLSAAPLEGSLKMFHEIGIKKVREVSLNKTTYLLELINRLLIDEPYNFSVGTPMERHRRGGHIALEHDDAWRINEALKARGVVPDFRYPNTIRLAPIAFYTSYYEIWQVVNHLKEVIDYQENLKITTPKGAVI